MRISILSWLLLVIIPACLACQESPGAVSLSFQWEQEPSQPVWVWVRVEERLDPTVSGPILASAGPAEYVPGNAVELKLGKVPNGSNRVVIADVREGASTGLPVLYFGVSAPFTISPGRVSDVEVPLALQAPAAADQEASIALHFNGEPRAAVGPGDLAAATVHTWSRHAAAILLANDASFTANVHSFLLSEDEGGQCSKALNDGGEWLVCDFPDWDLSEGIMVNDDPVRTVFARFIDQMGYESPVLKASVALDLESPQVLSAALSPPLARPGGTVLLSVNFDEALDLVAGAELTTAPDLSPGSTVSGPVRLGESNSYLWTLAFPQDVQEEGSFQFKVSGADFFGNALSAVDVVDDSGTPIVLVVDTRPPELVAPESIKCTPMIAGIESGGELLSFGFIIAEEHAPSINDTAGPCAGLCPEVSLGNNLLGQVLRTPDLDEPNMHNLAFLFEYTIEPADLGPVQTDLPLTITWSDAAGNMLQESLPFTVRMDFVPPECVAWQLIPAIGGSETVFTYSLTASEPLVAAPELLVEGTTPDLFDAPPSVSADQRTFTWSQPAEMLDDQVFNIAARLVDGAGNSSSGEGGFVCPATGEVDSTLPVLKEELVETTPALADADGKPLLACADQGVVTARFQVEEPEGMAEGFPLVILNVPGQPLPFEVAEQEELEEGLSSFVYTLNIDAVAYAQAEGSWPIQVKVRDLADNLITEDSLAGVLVTLDFTPPTASCSLFPELNTAAWPLHQKAFLQVNPHEPLLPGSSPELQETTLPEADGPLFFYQSGSAWQFVHTVVEGDGEMSFDVAVVLTDQVGNQTAPGTTACVDGLLVGALDGLVPAVFGVDLSVESGAVDPTTTPLRAGLVLTAIVAIAGSPVEPTVSVAGQPMAATEEGPVEIIDGHYSWTFQRTLDGAEQEGQADLLVSGADLAGNQYIHVEEAIATLDFTPPTAVCTVLPSIANMEDTIVISVKASEPLLGGLPALTSSLAFETPPESQSLEVNFVHEVIEADADVSEWTWSVILTDLAGNENGGEPACEGSGVIDALPPTLSGASLGTIPEVINSMGVTVLAAGDGDEIVAEFILAESQGLAQAGPTVSLTVPGLVVSFPPATVQDNGDGTYACSATLTLDKEEHPGAEGLWPVRVQSADLAGNILTTDSLADAAVRIDFTPPQAVCTLVPEPPQISLGIGAALSLQVTPNEELTSTVSPLIQEIAQPPLEAPFFVSVPGTMYRFKGTVDDSHPEASVELKVSLTDLVGNTTPAGKGACDQELSLFSIDGSRPQVTKIDLSVDDGEVEDLTTPLNAGRKVTAAIRVAGTASQPAVQLGGQPLVPSPDTPEPAGDEAYEWQFSRTLDGTEFEGDQWLKISGNDAAGNSLSLAVDSQPLTLDFTPPSAQCSLLPDPAKIGDTVFFTISLSEPVSEAQPLVSPLPWELSFKSPSGTELEYQYVVEKGAPEMMAEFAVQLHDLAGNVAQESASCLGSHLVDGAGPQIADAVIITVPEAIDTLGKTVLAAGADDEIHAIFQVHEPFAAEVAPKVYLATSGGQLHLAAGKPQVMNDAVLWDYSLVVDPVIHAADEGTRPVVVEAVDSAGNLTTVTNLAGAVSLDLTPPAADCTLVPPLDVFPLGQSVALQISPSEPLAFGTLPEVTLAPWEQQSLLTWEEGTDYRFSGTVEAAVGTETLSVSIVLEDVVGNATLPGESACVQQNLELLVDAEPIAVSAGTISARYLDPDDGVTWVQTGTHARHGSAVDISFELDEVFLPDEVKVKIGDELVSGLTFQDGEYQLEWTVDQPDGSGVSALPVTVQIVDSAGNVTTTVLGLFSLDFDPPEVVGIPQIERCDYYKPASPLAGNLWTKANYDCEFFGSADETCPGAAVGPIRVMLITDETLTTDRNRIYLGDGLTSEMSIDPCAAGNSLRAVYSPTGLEQETATAVYGVFQDLAGNRGAPTHLGDITFDFTAPEPPDSSVEGRVVYTRIPWGAALAEASSGFIDSGGLKSFFVNGQAGAVEPEAVVTVYDGASPAEAVTIGLGTAGEDGSFGDGDGGADALVLIANDRPYVWLSATDRAGNEGVPAMVRDVRWVSTFGGKVAGNWMSNPHRFETTSWFEGLLEHADVTQLDASSGIASTEGTVLTSGSDISFGKVLRMVNLGGEPAGDYDPVRGRIVVFGGETWNSPLSGSEWNGFVWSNTTPTDPEGDGDPLPRSASAIAYDSKRNVSVMFGGRHPTGLLDDTWLWNGVSWRQFIPEDPEGDGNPSARQRHSMSYDPLRDRIYMVGGTNDSLNDFGNTDVWEFNGSSWKKHTVSPAPSGRYSPAFAYSPTGNYFLLFGGRTSTGENDETWKWDGEEWQELLPAASPEPRWGAGLVFSAVDGVMVLISGYYPRTTPVGPYDLSTLHYNDLWQWTGDNWLQIVTNDASLDCGPGPCSPCCEGYSQFGKAMHGRSDLPAAGLFEYYPVRQSMILASGSDYDDLYPSRNHARGKYEIKDGDFIYLSQREDAAPTDPSGAAFMYNRKRKVSDYYNQTCSRYQGWSHENIWTGGPCKIQGNRWMYNYFSFDLDGDGNPPLRDDAGGVYAEHFNGGESALFGGEYACGNNTCYLADFWLYSSSSWFKPTVNLEPPGRSEMGLSYDTARQCIVLFGGKGTDLFDDTWELSAGGSPGSYIWTVISPDDPEGDGNPAAREGHVLVYDPDEQVTVLFGGRLADGSYSAETWLWDGTSWALVEQFDPEGDGNPDARADLAVAWHDSRGSLIIHGGLGEDGATDDVWEWTGVSWRVLSLVDAEGDGGPGARYDHAMVYDAHHDHLTLVGGEGASYERWIGRLGNTGRPAHIARFDTSVMDNCEAPDFTEVRILWRGGGTGFPDEPDYHGTTLMNWEKGEWQDVSDNSAGADAPEDLTWSTNDPDRIYRMLFGSHEELCFASAPVHPNGSGRTIVATDYLQLVVSYRMAEDAPDSCD